MKRAVVLGMLVCAGATGSANAADFGAHGYLDCRLIARADERSWADGGLGKTRFGGGGTSATCVQAGLVATAQLTPSLLALADIQYQTTDRGSLTALEAYVRWRPVSTTPLRWSVKLGEFFMPVSLENDAIGWTSPWTLTPSAINSWIGEEFRTIGAEARVEWRGAVHTFEGTLGLVRNNDPAGELLAARGWSLSDLTSGIGSRVREPDVYAVDNDAAVPLRFDPFVENDGRIGWYAGASWRANGYGGLSLLRYDNEADPTTHSGGSSPVFSWRTEFWSLGAEADAGDIVLLAQAMTGSTEIVPSPFFRTTTDFRAAYLLAGWNRGAWRPALRVDVFSTDQLPRDIEDRVREHGNAITLALNWRPREWLRVTGEALRVSSSRNQRIEEGIAARQTDSQVQLSARLMF
ncbi:MAG TPA: hypothetical protein VJ696_03865 [Rhodanobacteraceae bacterium]|nr:hypothetical protein [Rhodanobacteraceae bacterium]